MERKPNESWNFAALLIQGVARRVGNELTSEKLVLPFLYTALGGSVFFTGLFAPVVIVARLVAQAEDQGAGGHRGRGRSDHGVPSGRVVKSA